MQILLSSLQNSDDGMNSNVFSFQLIREFNLHISGTRNNSDREMNLCQVETIVLCASSVTNHQFKIIEKLNFWTEFLDNNSGQFFLSVFWADFNDFDQGDLKR